MNSVITHCPQCGHTLIISATTQAAQPGQWQAIQTMQSTAPLATGPAPAIETGEWEWERATPIGRLTPKDVKTSLLDAGIVFGWATIGMGGLCWYLEWPWWVSPAAGLTLFGWRYFGGMRLASRLLEVVETITNTDINDDGVKGKPEPTTVKVEVKTDQGNWQFAELETDPVKLQRLANATLDGQNFTERTATKLGFTQEEFSLLRDQFIERGWATWRHPTRKQQGVEISRWGWRVLQAIATTPLPPTDSIGPSANQAPASTQQHAAGKYAFIKEAK